MFLGMAQFQDKDGWTGDEKNILSLWDYMSKDSRGYVHFTLPCPLFIDLKPQIKTQVLGQT